MNVRTLLSIGLIAALAACAPRQVEVRTAPSQQAQASVQVTNNLAQAVNVYANTGSGQDTFLRQVAANSSVTIPVQSFAPGSSITLKAVTVDGVHTYTRNNVTLSGTYTFTLP
ncbi:MAG TPA: hypothetical protein VGM67_00910 [Gemmatimonadaceae bacterium]|jgi:hypothetical protein